MTRTLELLLLHRRWVAGLLAALVGFLNRQTPTDTREFSDLGQLVLAGRLDEVYAGPWAQAGPLQLVLSRVALFGGQDATPPAITRIVLDVALTLGAMAVCRGRPVREAVVAALALLWLLGPTPWSGHPAEVAIVMLWAYAMLLSSRGRWLAASLTLGLSVMIAPIGVLGFPCLLASTGIASAVRTALAGAGIALAGYLPFVLSGRFDIFGIVWAVDQRSLPHLLGMDEITWSMRLGQAVAVAGGCALIAYVLHGQLIAVAAAPLAAALLRAATDPLAMEYFWLPVSVGTVLLVALMPDDLARWRQVSFVVLGYLAMLAAATDLGPPGALLCLIGYMAAGLSLRHPRIQRHSRTAAPR